MSTFKLVPVGAPARSTPVEAQPIEGRWYCGFDIEVDGTYMDGQIAQYVGGEWFDEEGYGPVSMSGYDYLAEQF